MNVINGHMERGVKPVGAEILAAFPQFLQSLPIAFYACDAAGRLVWFNHHAELVWGRAPAIGDSAALFCGIDRICGPKDTLLDRDSSLIDDVLSTGERIQGRETVIVRPDGSQVVATSDINPVTDEYGEIVGAIGSLREETGRTATINRDFHRLLDALPAAVYTTDADGKITFYNRAAVELTGREPEIGREYWCITQRLFRPDGSFLPHDECPMAVALRENRPVRGIEIIAERPDGTRMPCLPYPTPIRDADGNILGGLNMIVDISERKQAEARQQKLLAELNHRVKNNMQVLDALLRTAQRRTSNAEAQMVLADAGRRVGAMAAAQQVLYEAGGKLEFDVGKFLLAVAAPIKRQCGERIALTLTAPATTLPNDIAMPLALIYNELLANAVSHGLHGRDHGTVATRLALGDSEYALSVEDDGPGFDFTPPCGHSSGLGLVQGLARQQGGTFEVTGRPGTRCTVRFSDPSHIDR